MMKTLLIFFLSLAAVGSAGLKITVNGIVDPPDSTITIFPSDWLVIGVADDGQTGPGSLAMGIYMGPGCLDASRIVTSSGVMAGMVDNSAKAEELNIQNPFISMEIQTSQAGMLCNEVDFHCEGKGDVTLALVDYETGEVLDIQVIHQVPEPMTLSILCLSGLFLKRRIA
jgi:hypothetical protein